MIKYIANNWIAIISLAVSIFLLYTNYLRSFRLQIHDTGRIQLAKNPFSEGLNQPCLLVDFIFANRGANTGVVEDVAISLKAEGHVTIFRTLLLVTDRTKNFQAQLPPPKAESFTAFELRKDESKVNEIMFIPLDSLPVSYFGPTTYTADIWAITSSDKDWTKFGSIVFNVTVEDLDALASSTVTPQPGGGYFIKWITRDKPLRSAEEKLQSLKLKVSAN